VSTQEELLAKELVEPFADRIAATFTDVRMHVPIEIAEAARALAEECGAQAVLSIGGGSTTGRPRPSR
jgi:alcohol dehydrogenase class IV